MASTWIVTRATKTGERRFRVEYRLGGREAPTRYGGSFRRKADALERQRWVSGELAARRVPELGSLEAARATVPTFATAVSGWLVSRLDVQRERGASSEHPSTARAVSLAAGDSTRSPRRTSRRWSHSSTRRA